MILYRQKRGVDASRLESRLLALRAYDAMLFATAATQPVREALSEAEMRNQVQRALGRIRAGRSVNIRYRRLRERTTSQPRKEKQVVRYTALHRLHVKRYLSRSTEKRRTRVRPKPKVLSPAEKRRSAKKALVDEVGTWLGSGKGEKYGMALSEETARVQDRRRAFGSRGGEGEM
jgi:hypothetical protein